MEVILTTPIVPPVTKDAAHRIALTLLNFAHNFPTDAHYDAVCSKHTEEMDQDKALFTAYEHLFTHSLLDVPLRGLAFPFESLLSLMVPTEDTTVSLEPANELPIVLRALYVPSQATHAQRRLADAFLDSSADAKTLTDLWLELHQYRTTKRVHYSSELCT